MATNVFDLYAKIGADTSGFDSAISGIKGAMSGLAGFVGDAAKKAAGAIASFGKSAIQTGMSFDASMAQVAATLGKSVDEVQDLRDFAKQMGESTRYSAMEAAQGLNYMALAGYDAEKSMKMLPEVMKLASAGGMQLGYASDVITDAQSALGLSIEQTSTLINQMAKTASSSNTNVSQLGEAILQIGGTAKDMKGGTLELTTVLGVLANNGMKGAEGGTHLRNMLNSLTKPTKDARKFMEEYNISLFDAQGNMRGLNEVFVDLNKVLGRMTQQDRKKVLTDLFNARDLKAAEALLASTNGQFDELMQKIKESEGAAAGMSKTQEDTAAGAKKFMESALEGLKINLSEFFMPTVTSGYNFLSGFYSDMSATIKAFMNNGTTGIKNMINILIGEAKRDFPKKVLMIFSSLDRIWIDVKDVGSHLLKKLLEPIISNSEEIGKGAVKLVSNLAGELTNPERYKAIFDTGFAIINGLADGLFSEQSLDLFFDHEKGMPKIISNLVGGIVDFLTGNKDDGTGGLLGAATKIVKKLSNYFEDERNRENFAEGARKILSSVANGLIHILRDGVAPLMVEVGKLWITAFCGSIDYDQGAWTIAKELAKAFVRNFGAGFEKLWKFIAHPVDSIDSLVYGGEYATDLGGVRISDELQEQYLKSDTDLDRSSWASAQKIRNQYGGLSGMSDKEILQWLSSGSWYAPDEWMNSLTDKERLELYKERHPDVKFGDGGIVTKPTRALIGERGEPEAVVPLGHETETSRALGFGGGVVIQFGDIYVSGVQDAGNEVIRNIDEALREWQLRQKRGIGGVAWQP